MIFKDPVIQNLIKKYPPPSFTDRSNFLYEDLIESIVSQQLSVKAADTIFGRFKKLFEPVITNEVKQSPIPVILNDLPVILKNPPVILNDSEGSHNDNESNSENSFPTPQQILSMPDDKIREAGISFQKISYIKSVADAWISGLIDKGKIQEMTDEEVIEALTQIRGVGKWTAEMILIFTLGRPDIFSIGDLGIRNAITRLYGITDKNEMENLAKTWQPYRSTACWYLWRSLENN